MTAHPILFSDPMVRALLAGTKTQTRRIVKPQFPADAVVVEVSAVTAEGWQTSGHSGLWWDDAGACYDDAIRCPYGMPGDTLWVRETWAHDDEDNALFYRADVGLNGDADDWERNRLEGVPKYRWRPSIHMPRAASRITLEVTGVRVERLQDISRGDAMAEGCPFPNMKHGDDPRQWYADLWNTINGPGSWDANPWVWVVEFRRTA